MSKARGLADLGNAFDDGALSNRNLIINGAMKVAQRGTSTTGVTSGVTYVADRMPFSLSSLGTWTLTQESDGPDGFANSVKMDCTNADASPAAADYVFFFHRIEGQDLQQLGYGTSGAQSMVLSFYVKSNKTGNGTVGFFQTDNSFKHQSHQYTINAANTWERKSIIIPSDTSGVINDDNGRGFEIEWALNSGSNFSAGTLQSTWTALNNTNRNPSNLGIGGSTSDYWQITGIQLEVGDTATPFEHKSYDQEHLACQRYFQRFGGGGTSSRMGVGGWNSNISADISVFLNHEMRVTPTVTAPSKGRVLDLAVAWHNVSSFTLSESTTKYVNIGASISGSSAAAQGDVAILGSGGEALDYFMDAEL
jgi:hypothetical protein